MKLYMLFLFCFSYGIISGQTKYSINIDAYDSSIANARNLITIHNILTDFEDRKIENSYWEESKLLKKSLGISYRVAKTVLLDFQVDYLAYIIQHEVFGHGYRYREFGYSKNFFNVNLFPPFGRGGGFARRGDAGERVRGLDESLTMNFGGIEANSILAKSLKQDWIKSGKINYSESLLYFYTFNNLRRYIRITKKGQFNTSANDILNYLELLNYKNGFTEFEDYKFTIEKLNQRSIINYFNTYQILSVYTYLKTFLIDGEKDFEYPTIKFGDTKWLPSIRYGLTPFGGEVIIENYIKRSNNIFGLDIRIGDNEFDNFWGVGFSYMNTREKLFSIDFFGDLWVQPALALGGDEEYLTKKGLGGRAYSEINWYFSKSIPVGLFCQIGYKAAGYIEGEVLRDRLIFRIGLSFK